MEKVSRQVAIRSVQEQKTLAARIDKAAWESFDSDASIPFSKRNRRRVGSRPCEELVNVFQAANR
jgi:hypothetical protein